MKDAVVVNGNGFLLEDLISIARENTGIRISSDSNPAIIKSRNLVDKWVKDNNRIYGVTTGFGALSNVAIAGSDTKKLQKKYCSPMLQGWVNLLMKML